MTTSKDIKARHDAVMFPCTTNYYQEPLAPMSGDGCRITDYDGKSYLDFFGGILSVSVGHANPRVNARILEQVSRLTHMSTLYPMLPMVELAEKLVRLAPGKIDRAFFTCSGTEANETAVMLAQTATGRQEMIALRHSYSGRSLLAQSLTAHANWRAVSTQVAAVKHAPAPYCYRCPFGQKPQSCALECAQDLEELIQTTTTGQIAGFIAEPILGVGGFIVPPGDYFKVAVGIIKKYGGVFIADEVQTGFGRTGETWWGIEKFGVEPDIMTMAKGIANGMPLGATLTTTEIAATLTKSSLSTFGGNPVSSSASLGVLETIEEDGLLENARARGAQLQEGLLELQRQFPKIIGDVRGMGLMQAMELVVDEPAGDRTHNPRAVLRLFEETKKRGLLIGRSGLKGNVARCAPALNVSVGEIAEAIHILEASFHALMEVDCG